MYVFIDIFYSYHGMDTSGNSVINPICSFSNIFTMESFALKLSLYFGTGP